MNRRWNVLSHLISTRGWTRGVELGVYQGETFKFLLRAHPDLFLTGVDLFDTSYYQSTRVDRPPKTFDLERTYWNLQAWLADQAYCHRAYLHRHDTITAAEDFADGSLDFVFVDADHRYEAVKTDLETWRPKIRKGGWMVGHDWNEPEFPGVVQAVTEWAGERPVRHYEDHVWAVPL